jgi:hypothetical protein
MFWWRRPLIIDVRQQETGISLHAAGEIGVGRISENHPSIRNLYCCGAVCALESIRLACDQHARTTETAMFDVVLVSVGFAFFFAAILYTVACDRL